MFEASSATNSYVATILHRSYLINTICDRTTLSTMRRCELRCGDARYTSAIMSLDCWTREPSTRTCRRKQYLYHEALSLNLRFKGALKKCEGALSAKGIKGFVQYSGMIMLALECPPLLPVAFFASLPFFPFAADVGFSSSGARSGSDFPSAKNTPSAATFASTRIKPYRSEI